MKVLLAVDGSDYSEAAATTLLALQMPRGTQITVATVVPEHTFLGGITLERFRRLPSAGQARKAQEEAAAQLLAGPVQLLREAGFDIETAVLFGKPAEEIVRLATRTKDDLVVVGAKGTSDSSRFPLGSVAQKVMKYAGTSVLLVREKTQILRRLLFAVDGSKYSDDTARFLLRLPLPRHTRVVLATSLESHVAALVKMPTLDLAANQVILEELQAAEEEAARGLISKTQDQFRSKGYETETLVLKGQPAAEIIGVANTIVPDLIAVGAKGLSGIDAFLLGSVAQRVARFARYSVLIVNARSR
jgi:nucleotide-binding universal stress UspA family protein